MSNDNSTKLFVGGLAPEFQEHDLKKYFSQFGNVTSVNVKRDAISGRVRGFGFVSFENANAVQEVVAVPVHEINGKRVDPKPAQPPGSGHSSYGGGGGGSWGSRGGSYGGGGQQPEQSNKVFVGGIDSSMSEEEIKAIFEKLGGAAVIAVEWPYDKMRQQRKNFLFVQFEHPDSVSRVLQSGNKQTIGSSLCDLKPAFVQGSGGGSGGGGHQMNGGGGGGYNRSYNNGYNNQMMMQEAMNAPYGANDQMYQWNQQMAAQANPNQMANAYQQQQYQQGNPNLQAYYSAYAAQQNQRGKKEGVKEESLSLYGLLFEFLVSFDFCLNIK